MTPKYEVINIRKDGKEILLRYTETMEEALQEVEYHKSLAELCGRKNNLHIRALLRAL